MKLESGPHEVAESWVIHINDRFKSDQYKLAIYRVPATIRAPKPEAYIPQVSSFGPYHRRKDKKLSAMDDHNLVAVHTVLGRFDDVSIDNLIEEVGNLEKQIRSCYEDSAIEYNKETLAWMFTMDAASF
ncbi:hypothetical protein SUGI_0701100 [Cryptomeria japonica]|nr:hypothetical protein SUGI_0701100 [Cryptomeria japonica]